MADKDPFMYVIIILTSIINGLLPFIWIFAPAYVIENRSNGIEFFIPFFFRDCYSYFRNEVYKFIFSW